MSVAFFPKGGVPSALVPGETSMTWICADAHAGVGEPRVQPERGIARSSTE